MYGLTGEWKWKSVLPFVMPDKYPSLSLSYLGWSSFPLTTPLDAKLQGILSAQSEDQGIHFLPPERLGTGLVFRVSRMSWPTGR